MGMKLNKKAIALIAGLTLSMSGTTFAASADDFRSRAAAA